MQSRQRRRRGLAFMVLACFMFSIMTVCVFAIGQLAPNIQSPAISFVRSLVNLTVLVLPALVQRRIPVLFGDGRPSLWLRGLFGASALMLSFAAIIRIGPGESSFLSASSGVFVCLLSPWIVGQRNSATAWIAILGAFAGIFLLSTPRFEGQDFLGRAMALVSGFLSALAYLMVARAGRSNRPETVIFYFCLVAIVLHAAWYFWVGWEWPSATLIWGVMIFGGLAASAAQHFMTRAYQLAPASAVSAVGYLAPVLSLGFGIWLFGRVPDERALSGCALVLGFGVVLPFVTRGAPERR